MMTVTTTDVCCPLTDRDVSLHQSETTRAPGAFIRLECPASISLAAAAPAAAAAR